MTVRRFLYVDGDSDIGQVVEISPVSTPTSSPEAAVRDKKRWM
jgi:hypothetical protein